VLTTTKERHCEVEQMKKMKGDEKDAERRKTQNHLNYIKRAKAALKGGM